MTEMNLGMTERLKPILERVRRMVRQEIAPLDDEFLAEVGKDGDRWKFTARQTEILEGLEVGEIVVADAGSSLHDGDQVTTMFADELDRRVR